MVVGYRAQPIFGGNDDVIIKPKRVANARTASFERPFERMRSAYKLDAEELLEQLRDREPTAHLVDPLLARSRATTKTTGRQRLATLQRTLDLMGLKRSKNQRE